MILSMLECVVNIAEFINMTLMLTVVTTARRVNMDENQYYDGVLLYFDTDFKGSAPAVRNLTQSHRKTLQCCIEVEYI